MEGLRKLRVSGKDWTEILLLRPTPKKGDPWGALAPLKDTPWGNLIPVVSGEAFSHAMYGHVMPLIQELGPPPKALAKRLPSEWAWCSYKPDKTCIIASEKCRPCVDLPECYEAPAFDNPLHSLLAYHVAMAWKEGRYVVVVEGEEFSL